MESPLDPFASGFDAVPDITDADAFSMQFGTDIVQLADELDAIAAYLERWNADRLSLMSNGIAELNLQLFNATDKPLERIKAKTAEVVADLSESVDGPLEDIGAEIQQIAAPLAACGFLPPPHNPFWNQNGINADAACNPANADILEAYTVATLEWLEVVDPELHAQARDFLNGSSPWIEFRAFHACGKDVWIYRCATEPPNPPPEIEPPSPPPPDILPGAVTPPDLTGCVISSTEPYDPQIFGGNVQQNTTVERIVSGVRYKYVAGSEFASPRVMFVYRCGILPPPPPPVPPEQIEPEPPPPPIDESVAPDWVMQLCECLSAKKFDGLKVWQQCDTCEIRIQARDAEDPDNGWTLIAEIDENGDPTYVGTCVVPEQPEPIPEELPPDIEPELAAQLAEGKCVMPQSVFWTQGNIDDLIAKLSGAANVAAGTGLIGMIASKFSGLLQSAPALAILFTLMGKSLEYVDNVWGKLFCFDNVTRRRIASRQIYGIFERVMPGGYAEPIARLTQRINESCPYLMPTTDSAHAGYLANTLSVDEWRCIVRANGYMTPYQERIVNGMRTRPGVNELNILRRRRVLDQQGWRNGMRGVGVVNDAEADQLFSLSEQRPPLTDILRFMVRDVDDPNIVNTFGLDTDFNAKYGAQLKEWAEDQGIPDKIAQYAWRAHWSIPSPTQLYEMFHRLGRDVDGNPIPQFFADVKLALQQQDILPFWIQKLLDVSYRLPTRVDVRRAYKIGVFTEQDVFQQYVKLGYEKQVCTALTRFSTQEKLQSWSTHKYVTAFSRGELSETELRELLAGLKATTDAIDFAVKWGRTGQLLRKRDKCLKAIRRRVFIGEIDAHTATQLANAEVNDPQTAQQLVNTWFCERESAGKELPLRQIMVLFREQVIDAADLYSRLIGLRYNPADAQAIVDRAVKELQRTIDVAEQKRLDKVRKDAEKLARATEKAEKQRQTDAARTEKAREAARKADRAREVKIMQAAKTLANRTGESATLYYGRMLNVYRAVVRNGFAKADQAADAAIKAAEVNTVDSADTWEDDFIAFLSDAGADELVSD